MLASGLSLCLLCAGLPWRSRLLMRIGADAYAVFLFHVFFTAGVRTLLQAAGIQAAGVPAVWLHIGLGLAAGVVGPMLLARRIGAQPLLAWLCLGQRRDKGARRPAALQAVSS
jgi:hypothetical protein